MYGYNTNYEFNQFLLLLLFIIIIIVIKMINNDGTRRCRKAGVVLSAPSFWSEVTVSPGPGDWRLEARWQVRWPGYTRHMATPHLTPPPPPGGNLSNVLQLTMSQQSAHGSTITITTPLSVLHLAILVVCPLPRVPSSSPGHTLLLHLMDRSSANFTPQYITDLHTAKIHRLPTKR